MNMRLAAALVLCAALPLAAQLKVPPTRTVEVADTYFGKTYKDPYRWLEDLKSPEVEAWFKAQAQVTDGALGKLPGVEALAQEWLALDKLRLAAYGGITVVKGRVFYKKTLGGENVGRLFMRQGWMGAEKLLFDPGTYKAGVITTLESVVPSPDGRLVALGLSSGGAEYAEVRVLEVATGKLRPERIFPSRVGPMGWTVDSTSFFYDAGRTTDLASMDIQLNRMTMIHRLGTPVAKDRELFSSTTNPELGITPKDLPLASIDESYPHYIIGNVSTVQNEMTAYYAPTADLKTQKLRWQKLCDPSDSLVRGLAFHKDHVYAITHAGAAKYKVVRTSIRKPDWKHAETVIPEAADSIQYLAKSRNYLFVVYSDGIAGRILRYHLATGATSALKLPAKGTVDISCPDWRTDRCLVTLTSWTFPTTRYDYDAGKDTLAKSAFNTAVTYPGFDQLMAEEVEVPSHDGTLVPLSIIHRKDLKLDGSASCILEGYGAYGISYTPSFTTMHSLALRGVVIAYAHPRGGSEKGEAWYRAGYKATKPNTWKDFIACGEYLVKRGYTAPAHLGGTGTSAGGILISRAITERPDLFAAAVCNVGCANTMRGEFSPNGPINTPEFGTVQDAAECAALFEMDGVQHVQAGVKYPAVLGVGGWNDPRVSPWQPGKFVAAMQAASTSGRPALLKVNYDNGHFTEEKQVAFRNFANQFGFLLWQTGHRDFQPAP